MKVYHGLIAICFVLLLLPTTGQAVAIGEDNNANGPYLDYIEYHVIDEFNDIDALLNDEIDLIGRIIDPSEWDAVENENIETKVTYRNGYGRITFNTERWPLNYSALRQAFAYSFNKSLICELENNEITPIDSVLPLINPFSIENEFPDTYYDVDVASGADLLADAGFYDSDLDGDLDAPNGTAFQIVFEYYGGISELIANESVDAFTRLQINATTVNKDFFTIIDDVTNTGDFDMTFLGHLFQSSDPSWLANEYGSETAGDQSQNPSGFANSTFDSWIPQLINGTTFEAVYEAAEAMQEILWEACPVITVYSNIFRYAHRNDTYEGFVNDAYDGIASYWTDMKTRQITTEAGPLGGTLRRSFPSNHTSFNFMAAQDSGSKEINKMLWDTLLQETPERELMPWIAESWDIRTNETDPTIDDGHVVYTFYLVQNATFSDGHPLTADDVAFSLLFYRDDVSNPSGFNLQGMVDAQALSNYILQVEFETESFWNLYHTGLSRILPEHIMNVYSPNQYMDWDPDADPENMVTSGPFKVVDYHHGFNCTLQRTPTHWKHLAQRDDSDAPIVEDTSDFTIEWGTPAVSIFWDATDAYPYFYRVFKNSSIVESGTWDGSYIQYNIAETLTLGVHNFTIEFTDYGGRTSTDSVFITVLDNKDPILDAIGTSAYQFATTGHQLNFTCFDDHPDAYEFYANNVLVESGDWTGEDLDFDIDGYAIGLWNFTLLVNDTSGNTASESAYVTVYESANPLIEAPDSYTYQYGSTGHWLNWSLYDLAPDSYEFYINDELQVAGNWNGQDLNFSADGYDLGIWKFTLFVNDTSGNSARGTAFIIVEDSESPIIVEHESVEYIEGSTDNWIRWQVDDVLPDSYILYRNGTPIASGSWNSGYLNVSIDGLNPGVYNYRLVVRDTSGNIAESSVIVTVAPATTPPPMVIIVVGTAIGVIAIVFAAVACKRRQ
ncbi:MAG: hypothetical protein GF411_05975 [Candidatus Lokiarchaeota archaeon]|nr:hypothetical protein [Candidatus Lokiarchaeota archaeon]